MRIIGGKYKGKILASFDGESIRPTSDRAREALFNILQLRIANSVFYDAFSGSGAVGIEAISRSAKQVVFTDVSKDSIQLTKKNLLSIKESATIENIDALTYLKRTSIKFDLIFLDPPYKNDEIITILQLIADRKILSENGIVIYEHNANNSEKRFAIDGFELYSTKKYGIAEFDFYRWKE